MLVSCRPPANQTTQAALSCTATPLPKPLRVVVSISELDSPKARMHVRHQWAAAPDYDSSGDTDMPHSTQTFVRGSVAPCLVAFGKGGWPRGPTRPMALACKQVHARSESPRSALSYGRTAYSFMYWVGTLKKTDWTEQAGGSRCTCNWE